MSVKEIRKGLTAACNATTPPPAAASKYMKKDICVITSSFTDDSSKMDKVWDVKQFSEKDQKIAFYFFSNLELDK